MIINYWKHVVIVLSVLLCFYLVYQRGYEHATEQWQVKWSQRDAQDAERLAQRQSEARIQEQQWQEKVGDITNEARQRIKAANSDVLAARATANGLHDKANKLAKRLAERERACDTTFADRSKTTAGSELLADLFRRADETAGSMAEAADRARIAGQACERAYNSLTQ